MGRRWTEEDIAKLKTLARRYPLPVIAERIDRSVGAVTFKAHQIKVPLQARHREGQRRVSVDPGAAGFDLEG
jgi:bifunctional pyridoxal-dependent enzyme with beta-cystathionase and maltose regulon repressor activities